MPKPNPDLIIEYVLDTLPSNEKRQVETQCQKHPEIWQEIQELQEVMGLLAHSAPQRQAPAHLRQRLRQAIHTPPQPERTLWQKVPKQKLLAVIAGILLIGLAIDNYWLRRKLDLGISLNIPGMQEGEVRIFPLQGQAVAAQATGSVLIDFETSSAVLALTQLPHLSPGESYHLWAKVDQKYIACGRFLAPGNGQIISRIPVPIQEYTKAPSQMIITIESQERPQQPSSKVIMVSSS